jgi:hypothetical protein
MPVGKGRGAGRFRVSLDPSTVYGRRASGPNAAVPWSELVAGAFTAGAGILLTLSTLSVDLLVGGGLAFDVAGDAGKLRIALAGVTDAMLRNSAATSVVGRSAGSAGPPADVAASADGDVLRRAAGVLGFGMIPESSVSGLVADLLALTVAVVAKVSSTRVVGTLAPLSGGGDLSADRTLSLLDDGVTDAKLRNSAGTSVIGRSLSGSGDPADIAAGSDGDVLRRAAGVLGFGTIPASSVIGAVPAARAVNTTAPLSGGGDLSADRTLSLLDDGVTDAKLRNSAGTSVIGRSAGTSGDPADITAGADGDVLRRSGGVLGFGPASGLSGVVPTTRLINTTAPLSGGGDLSADRTLSLLDDGVTDAKLRNSAALSVIGRSSSTSGDPADVAASAAGQVLRVNAAGTALEWAVPVREHWFPAEVTSTLGDYQVRSVSNNANWRFTFQVPHDFGSLVSVDLIGAPQAGAGTGKNIDLTSDYGAVGESTANHSESDAASTYDTGTNGKWFALSLSSVFSSLAAGDFCGVNVTHNSVGGTIDYLGIRLRYNQRSV